MEWWKCLYLKMRNLRVIIIVVKSQKSVIILTKQRSITMKTKIQWHPAFAAAMDLELIQNRNDLIYEKEYNLNTKPLEIDLLVIKKESSVHIANEIGFL